MKGEGWGATKGGAASRGPRGDGVVTVCGAVRGVRKLSSGCVR